VLGMAAGSFRVSVVLADAPSMSPGTLLAGTLLLTVGIVGKSAQFPLHVWLPDAMAGPAPVSALIHAATMVAAGAYVVARLYPAFEAAPATLAVIGVLAVISMVGSALAALAVDDLKRVLAYSTISQLSVMFAGLAVGGRTAAVGHLLSHAAFKALLFLCAGAVIHAVASNLMADMGGLRHGMPLTFATMTIGFGALAGVPPTSGFFTKDAVVAAAMHHGGGVGVLVTVGLMLTVALTAAYATRAWLRTFFGRQRSALQVHEAPPVMTVPLVVLAIPALGLGVAGLTFAELRPESVSALLSVLFAIIGGGIAYALWRLDPSREPANALGRLRPVFGTVFRTDDLYERTAAPATLALARATVGVDDRVVGRTVTGTGRGARALGGVLRLTQNGNPQFYVTGVLAGVLLLALGVALLW
jgi:NADH-quinone oxidoreductase subunit L